MHIWMHLIYLILLAFCVWNYKNIWEEYEQLNDECHPEFVEPQEEEILEVPTCELNQFNNYVDIAVSTLTHALIVFVGYLSYNILKRHIKIICNSHKLVNEVQNYTSASKNFQAYIDKIESENKNNKTKWVNKLVTQQHRILKLKRQIKITKFQKQLLASYVQNLLSKLATTRKRSVQYIEFTNIQQDTDAEEQFMETTNLKQQYDLDFVDDIIDQSNDIQMESPNEPTDRKLSFFQRIGTLSGSFFKSLNTNQYS
ncbi:unnamed protein product [Diamesa serratosioi]